MPRRPPPIRRAARAARSPMMPPRAPRQDGAGGPAGACACARAIPHCPARRRAGRGRAGETWVRVKVAQPVFAPTGFTKRVYESEKWPLLLVQPRSRTAAPPVPLWRRGGVRWHAACLGRAGRSRPPRPPPTGPAPFCGRRRDHSPGGARASADAAARLRAHSDAPVAGIAADPDFPASSSFGRFFRRHAGRSPGALRATIREKYQDHREIALPLKRPHCLPWEPDAEPGGGAPEHPARRLGRVLGGGRVRRGLRRAHADPRRPECPPLRLRCAST